ncbi:MAG: sialate O-acetylesterase [Tepidisphaeraceae bacterium]
MTPRRWGASAALAMAVVAAMSAKASADVTPACLFTENAVLQRDMPLPVWGTATPGETVKVSIDGQSASAVAGTDGKWMVKLPPLQAGGPFTMTIAGKNTLTLGNILIGDVWLASGQSNMEYGVTLSSRGEIANANDSQLRIFKVEKAAALSPINDIRHGTDFDGKWVIATPESLANCGGWGGFSAVGYFFGRDIRQFTHQPVGLIGSYWGGTPAQAWTSLEALANDPILAHYAGETTRYAQQTKFPYPFHYSDFQAAHETWKQQVGQDYLDKQKAWKSDARKARAAHEPVPPEPTPSLPEPPELHGPEPTLLYNAMIAPLIPYAIKGTIWYQGESNAGRAKEYRELFPAMIADWRARWGEGNFPFLFVQIAPFHAMGPQIREAQLLTLSKSPNTAMAVTTDVGDADNIHPKEKLTVGHRLALAARAIAYGDKIEYSGPLFDKADFDGGKAVVHFMHVGEGLMCKGSELKGFEIAGDDGKFVPATAKIEGDTVVAQADRVAHPTAVRYGWANVPDVNLYNKDGLPASPFRSNVD